MTTTEWKKQRRAPRVLVQENSNKASTHCTRRFIPVFRVLMAIVQLFSRWYSFNQPAGPTPTMLAADPCRKASCLGNLEKTTWTCACMEFQRESINFRRSSVETICKARSRQAAKSSSYSVLPLAIDLKTDLDGIAQPFVGNSPNKTEFVLPGPVSYTHLTLPTIYSV